MKRKNLFLIIIATAIVTFACKKDDDKSNISVVNSSILGNWRLTKSITFIEFKIIPGDTSIDIKYVDSLGFKFIDEINGVFEKYDPKNTTKLVSSSEITYEIKRSTTGDSLFVYEVNISNGRVSTSKFGYVNYTDSLDIFREEPIPFTSYVKSVHRFVKY